LHVRGELGPHLVELVCVDLGLQDITGENADE
jgi:hypothetical protein